MDNFNENFDGLVIGGGIIGMLTARQLHSQGLKIAVLDKGKLGGEATWAAGGILSPLNPWEQNVTSQPLIDEGRQSFAALANELKQETGINPEYLQSGMFVLNVSDDEYQTAYKWAKLNNETIELIPHTSLHKHEPNLAKNFQQALYLPDIAQVRPPKLIAALKQSLSLKRIKIFEQTEVKELVIDSSTVKGVHIKNKNIYANKVILCSGAWTKYLSQNNLNIDIEPVRGQMLLYKLDKKLLSHIVLKDKTYLIPRQDGHILCGSTLEHVGFNNQVTKDARNQLESIACQLVPELANRQVRQQWSALRPGTKRDTPYICKHPEINGLYINSGHYRYGIIMSIASARLMSDLITNSLNRSQITAFA